MQDTQKIEALLAKIYGPGGGEAAWQKLRPVLEKYPRLPAGRQGYFGREDVMLITYGDSLLRQGEPPLETLGSFAREHLGGVFSAVHILPFFPYSSDDGFSVIDYKEVDPGLGTWEEVRKISGDFALMFDLVLNHISARSPWFASYLAAEPGFGDLAIEVAPGTDLSRVVRPRALPLLTGFTKKSGELVSLWTTFSADQVDLNFGSPDVLARMVDVLLFYVHQGASYIRLDAIAYLWKKIGTSCIHLPETHQVVRLFRLILDLEAPGVVIITETNVPHRENISYFGDGADEAQMVYNFTLPPLLLYTFINQDATLLSSWAGSLQPVSDRTTFFNFTASHDGIGVRPLEGIMPQSEIETLAEAVRRNGGMVSCRRNPDGTESPYELNVSYVDALRNTGPDGRDSLLAERFLASQSVPLVLPGMPAVYIHSILGSRNWSEGVRRTGRARTINREKLQADEVLSLLADPGSFRARVFHPYCRLIRTRAVQEAFHPRAACSILHAGPQVFAVKREAAGQAIYALTNVSASAADVNLPASGIPGGLTDLVSGRRAVPDLLELAPYQVAWLSSVP
ncbi:MAG: sugar phosphorylase [Candidatus Glassbacteria bacterium]|nr:sugar phosphorylase [Candidatus Glassbacteria bacterium]